MRWNAFGWFATPVLMFLAMRDVCRYPVSRGKDRGDVSDVADCLQRLSQLVTDYLEIMELDINPLMVGPQGRDPVVEDARITISQTRIGP
jgi:acetate---CoA ligase (ADP-forming)